MFKTIFPLEYDFPVVVKDISRVGFLHFKTIQYGCFSKWRTPFGCSLKRNQPATTENLPSGDRSWRLSVSEPSPPQKKNIAGPRFPGCALPALPRSSPRIEPVRLAGACSPTGNRKDPQRLEANLDAWFDRQPPKQAQGDFNQTEHQTKFRTSCLEFYEGNPHLYRPSVNLVLAGTAFIQLWLAMQTCCLKSGEICGVGSS